MTLKELYSEICGDYDQAIHILRMDKLIDKHIRRFTASGVVEDLLDAGNKMDPVGLFEKAHAMKGVCANLGLDRLSGMASEITEEFRPGHTRTLSDAEVSERLSAISELYKITADGIKRYEEG